MTSTDELKDPKQAAAHIRSTESTLANWRCAGRGPKYIKLGGKVLYRRTDLDAFLEACIRDPQGAVRERGSVHGVR
jgi:hypothetical protein